MSDQLTSQSRSNESGITRRTALRGAAWSASAVTVVVATPNIAAASPGSLSCTITGTRDGTNFYATISCGASGITSVQFGSTPAVLSGGKYTAKLGGSASNVQTVTVVTNSGSVTKSVRFAG
jgi:hypothetical protein